MVVLVSPAMSKRVLSRKTSRGAAPRRKILNTSSAMRYAGGAVETLRTVQENPSMFIFGDYDRPGQASLEEATRKAQRALDEGKVRAAATFACDISDLLADMPSRDKQPGGAKHDVAEEAREVAERAIKALEESLRNAAR